jgi:uncharacterized HAD superfamily protein
MKIGIDIDGVLTDVETYQLDLGSKYFYLKDKTCEEVSKLNVKTMMMNSRLNTKKQTPNILRVFSWDDINENIE